MGNREWHLTRREALRGAAAAGAGLTGAAVGVGELISRALAAAPGPGKLNDIEHVIILMQENRSFDHYFGTLRGVRGFADRHGRSRFFQRDHAGHRIHPFRLSRQCEPDLTHDWGPQHSSWAHGRMDNFVRAHQDADRNAGVETMGCYTRADVPFYFALAEAFTICDAYHCSVMGPTDPNRLYSMSATIDPDGARGGPLLNTNILKRGPQSPSRSGPVFTWTTMPEALDARGVSWKVYTDNGTGAGFEDNVLTYFEQYAPGTTLHQRGLEPTFPNDFMSDLASGRLPQVSWLCPSIFSSEHPGYANAVAGEAVVRQVLEALVSQPMVWRKSAVFVTWDENGGFFDHVAPPTAPPGTRGEYLTIASLPPEAEGIRGPIGLGFRVPMLVVSPFSRGGLVCSETFDHTSTLRFLETRFGVEVPNLSAWRRKHTGDLTGAFNFASPPVYGQPRLPGVHPGRLAKCDTLAEHEPAASGPFPRQARGKRRRPSGPR